VAVRLATEAPCPQAPIETYPRGSPESHRLALVTVAAETVVADAVSAEEVAAPILCDVFVDESEFESSDFGWRQLLAQHVSQATNGGHVGRGNANARFGLDPGAQLEGS
jgi:hypothetical protein